MKYKALFEEALDLLSAADYEGHGAHHIFAPEDAEVRALCERIGYGAVMDSASRQWYLRSERDGHAGANHTTGHCAATIRRFMQKVAEARGAK